MNPLRDHLTWALNWARHCLHDVIKDWPEDRITFQATAADNHLLWTLGHMAVSDEWILAMLTGKPNPLPEEFSKPFGYESTVSASVDAYPPAAEVKRQFEQARARLLEYLEGINDAKLRERFEGGEGFAETALEAMQKEAWHEGWHAGQLATLRRALGLKPAFASDE
ncbi:MAG: DinB family protein [Phycisphaerales bacterium]|nr:MAG: DinB family protein [Phycisphaerales bacterium]